MGRSPRRPHPDGGAPAEGAADRIPEGDPRLAPFPAGGYVDVDVAIVAESTYPYLKGGVSAVMHDIIVGNPGLTFGIIHIAWDSKGSRRQPVRDAVQCAVGATRPFGHGRAPR